MLSTKGMQAQVRQEIHGRQQGQERQSPFLTGLKKPAHAAG